MAYVRRVSIFQSIIIKENVKTVGMKQPLSQTLSFTTTGNGGEYRRNSMIENTKSGVKDCHSCPYAKRVYTGSSWYFIGCYCSPYHGKCVAEIERCPKEEQHE